jgi:hypothetical protein
VQGPKVKPQYKKKKKKEGRTTKKQGAGGIVVQSVANATLSTNVHI